MTDLVTTILATLTLIGDGVLVVALLLFIFSRFKRIKPRKKLQAVFEQYGLLLAFSISLLAALGSLFFSEIAHFEPCKLCWYQRIFMYPQVILLGMAFWKKDRSIIPYSLVLSAIGALIAFYHYYIQRGGVSFLPCTSVGYSVSCTKTFTMEFGYITIPAMALTAFLLMFSIMLGLGSKRKK